MRNDFELHFRYPTEDERKQLMIIHRDMTNEEKKRIESGQQALLDLIEDLTSGKVHKEDLRPEIREKLTLILGPDGEEGGVTP